MMLWPRLDRGLTPSVTAVENWIPSGLLPNAGYKMSRAGTSPRNGGISGGDPQNLIFG
jgi:hypothetical protein